MKAKIIKQCAFCHGDFEYTIHRKKYCSTEHANEQRLEESKAKFPWKYEERICLNSLCGKHFYPNYEDHVYHSKSCAAIVNNPKRGPRSEETKRKISRKSTGQKRPPKNLILKWNQCSECKTLWSIGFRKSTRTTCSDPCLKIAQSRNGRKSASHRVKRSRDEIKLFGLCFDHFKNVTHNEILYDGWDADIIIHDTKTAILWNGPWHYRQMEHKKYSLLQVQNRDKFKTKLFEANGWKVIIFEDRHYTPFTAFAALLDMGGP